MKLLLLADKPTDKPIKSILSENPWIDLIVTLGDLYPEDISELSEISEIRKIWVYWNHCDGVYMDRLWIDNMHLKSSEIGGLRFFWYQGCVKYKENPLMSTQEYCSAVMASVPYADVLITHCPPKWINDNHDPSHYGFEGLREFVDREKPKYVFHWHTYDFGKFVQKYGETEIIYVHGWKVHEIEWTDLHESKEKSSEAMTYIVWWLKAAGKTFIERVPWVAEWFAFLEGAEYNLSIKKRERAEELVNTLLESGLLLDELFKSENFSEAFFRTLHKYAFEFNERKRRSLANVLIWFSNSYYQEEFNLERYFDVIQKLDSNLILLLEKVSKHKIWTKDKFILPKEWDEQYGSLKYLESLGTVICSRYSEIENRMQYDGDEESGFSPTWEYEPVLKEGADAEISKFWTEVLAFIKK